MEIPAEVQGLFDDAQKANDALTALGDTMHSAQTVFDKAQADLNAARTSFQAAHKDAQAKAQAAQRALAAHWQNIQDTAGDPAKRRKQK